MASVVELGESRYVNLATFKRDGTHVWTPVWAVEDGGRLLVWSGVSTWKVRRIRRNADVLIVPCMFRGKPRGSVVGGEARILEDVERVEALLRRKYRLSYPLLRLLNTILRVLRRQPPGPAVTIEVTLL